MHASVMAWIIERARTLHFESQPRVLEVGSANINGSVRPSLEALLLPAQYIGLDIAPGPGVDVVCPIEQFPGTEQFDLIVSAEMLEHCLHWQDAVRAMARLLKPGGTLLLTCRGPGFFRHNPPDYWRFTPDALSAAAHACGLGFPGFSCADPQVPGAFLMATKLAMPTVMREPGWLEGE